MRFCLDNKYYYLNDILIIMNIKREINLNFALSLRKNIFSISENRAIRTPNNSFNNNARTFGPVLITLFITYTVY